MFNTKKYYYVLHCFGTFPNEKKADDVITKLENAGSDDYTIQLRKRSTGKSGHQKKKVFSLAF
jgi:hypothetical protein